MKTRILICFVCVIFFITPIVADDISIEECMKLVSGTWINNEYRGDGIFGKQIRHENGWVDAYIEATDTEIYRKGKIEIVEAWVDNEGDVWFKTHSFVGEYEKGVEPSKYDLCRISKSGNVLEYIWSYHGPPTEIDPNHLFYRIYYRQE